MGVHFSHLDPSCQVKHNSNSEPGNTTFLKTAADPFQQVLDGRMSVAAPIEEENLNLTRLYCGGLRGWKLTHIKQVYDALKNASTEHDGRTDDCICAIQATDIIYSVFLDASLSYDPDESFQNVILTKTQSNSSFNSSRTSRTHDQLDTSPLNMHKTNTNDMYVNDKLGSTQALSKTNSFRPPSFLYSPPKSSLDTSHPDKLADDIIGRSLFHFLCVIGDAQTQRHIVFTAIQDIYRAVRRGGISNTDDTIDWHTAEIRIYDIVAIMALASNSTALERRQFLFELFDWNFSAALEEDEMVGAVCSCIRGIASLMGSNLPDQEELTKVAFAAFMHSDAITCGDGQSSYTEICGWLRASPSAIFVLSCMSRRGILQMSSVKILMQQQRKEAQYLPFLDALIFSAAQRHHSSNALEESASIAGDSITLNLKQGRDDRLAASQLHRDRLQPPVLHVYSPFEQSQSHKTEKSYHERHYGRDNDGVVRAGLAPARYRQKLKVQMAVDRQRARTAANENFKRAQTSQPTIRKSSISISTNNHLDSPRLQSPSSPSRWRPSTQQPSQSQNRQSIAQHDSNAPRSHTRRASAASLVARSPRRNSLGAPVKRSKPAMQQLKKEVLGLFDLFVDLDKDDQGSITTDEWARAIHEDSHSNRRKSDNGKNNNGQQSSLQASSLGPKAGRNALVKNLLSVFESLDINSDGGVTFDEILLKLFPDETPEAYAQMLLWAESDARDRRKRGERAGGFVLSHHSSSHHHDRSYTGEEDQYLREIYRMWDHNADGFLSVGELADVMKKTGVFSTADAQKEFSCADEDGSGQITYEEFRREFGPAILAMNPWNSLGSALNGESRISGI